ncbi:hypothetical protein ABZ153_01685 [Streptomyces sp. NPDC006290]
MVILTLAVTLADALGPTVATVAILGLLGLLGPERGRNLPFG